MSPIWILEVDVFGAEESEALKAELRRQQLPFELVRVDLLSQGFGPDVGACVIFRGSFPLIRQIQLHHGWIPGGWCAFDRLDCQAYYPHFKRFLLNQDHTILTGMEAIERGEEIYEKLGVEDEVFIRPSACSKLLTGRRVHRDDFARALAPTKYDPETKIVIAPPREIDREWRLVIAEDHVIAASQYAVQGAVAFERGCPPSVSGFVEHILDAAAWRPEELFVMDIGECEGDLWLIELNSFSCSGLYHCDMRPIVTTASNIAKTLWEINQETGV